MCHAQKSKQATPISVARQPEMHDRHRQYGLTSIALSADASRVYTLCRDNTVYAYSTSHLILGSCQQWDNADARVRRGALRSGLGPIYGLRHPAFQASSFYVKLSVQPGSAADRGELLAVGSTSSSPVVFHPDDRLSKKQCEAHRSLLELDSAQEPTPSSGSSLASQPDTDLVPIYNQGIPLVQGHDKEVTDVAWTSEGNLLTLGDDLTCRLWRRRPEGAGTWRPGAEIDGRCGYGCLGPEQVEHRDDSE